MSGWRHAELGTGIDRDKTLSFTFDGKPVTGFKGDTLASALLANGVQVLGRSFKYHRPRGLWGMGADEPNAIFDVALNGTHQPNLRATTTLLKDGMVVRSVNAHPTAARDRFSLLDRLHRVLPAGFYYKTFMALGWMRHEPLIRRMAGLGRVDPGYLPDAECPHENATCDLMVVGAGPAGLAAAHAAAQAGRKVWLIEDAAQVGGSLRTKGGDIDGAPWGDFAGKVCEAVDAGGGKVLTDTCVWGAFDHGLFAAWQRCPDGPDRHLRIRAKNVVFTTGALERPLWFANNDLPGVMSCEAAHGYLNRHGSVAGRKIVLATGNDASYVTAVDLVAAGANVTVLDARAEAPDFRDCEQIKGATLRAATGKSGVTGAVIDGQTLSCDAILCSGGHTPTVHLWCQSGGKLDWDKARDALVPRPGSCVHKIAGAVAGKAGLQTTLSQGHALFSASPPPRTETPDPGPPFPFRPDPTLPGRQWIDPQNDVTLKDIELAAREGYTSVEHLKRYTTLGMATDQGRSSNFAGLAAMAAITRRSIPQTGTTTYRPPFEPVPLEVIAGRRRGALFSPPKRLFLEDWHRDKKTARFREYGGWLRPSVHGEGNETTLAQQEALVARTTAAVFDASPLGKLEVIGPGAGQLLDFTGYMRMSTLQPGRARYGLMLAESGTVYDDGVVLRLDEHRFIVSASSSHVDGVRARLEDARQDRVGRDAVHIHDVTQGFVTLTVTGPKSREVLSAAGINLPDIPHMGVAETTLDGNILRAARISFTGETSFELTTANRNARDLVQRLERGLKAVNGCWIGLEAVMILRAEKGFILVGKDTDGNTMPQDLGWPGPMTKRQDEFLGKRALFTPEGQSGTRRQWVGLSVDAASPPLITGAHLVPASGARRSLGFVTSSCHSPNLDRAIALGLLENGRDMVGSQVGCFNNGEIRMATVTGSCAFDPEGERLHG